MHSVPAIAAIPPPVATPAAIEASPAPVVVTAPPPPAATPAAVASVPPTPPVAPVPPGEAQPASPESPRPAAPAPQVETAAEVSGSFYVARLDLRLVPIAAGSFLMGSATSTDETERPVTRVNITRSFWLGKTEVTRGQWKQLMGADPSEWRNEGGDDRPVEGVSWTDAVEFCRRLTAEMKGELPPGYVFTLPTEAEWEYACRAGSTGEYSGNLDAMAWYGVHNPSPAAKGPQPVGRKQPNAWGLYDMHGNVSEWCLDFAEYTGAGLTDPYFNSINKIVYRNWRQSGRKTKSSEAHCAAVRGGGWDSPAEACRSAWRTSENDFGASSGTVGFRVALAPLRDPATAKKVTHTFTQE
jgi:formylglycine-generating enzyme required for sulfatase activity